MVRDLPSIIWVIGFGTRCAIFWSAFPAPSPRPSAPPIPRFRFGAESIQRIITASAQPQRFQTHAAAAGAAGKNFSTLCGRFYHNVTDADSSSAMVLVSPSHQTAGRCNGLGCAGDRAHAGYHRSPLHHMMTSRRSRRCLRFADSLSLRFAIAVISIEAAHTFLYCGRGLEVRIYTSYGMVAEI